MWIEEVAPERLAELIRRYHQALEVSGKGSESVSWNEVATPDKNRFVAAAHLMLLQPHSNKNELPKPHRYFADPGNAEWGC